MMVCMFITYISGSLFSGFEISCGFVERCSGVCLFGIYWLWLQVMLSCFVGYVGFCLLLRVWGLKCVVCGRVSG